MTQLYKQHSADDDIIEINNPSAEQDLLYVPPDDLDGLQPGAWLKRLREQKSLSVEHVADRLFLNIAVITALEEGNYAELPPPIFVRGYIRSYAKLLEVPSSDQLVLAYNAMQPDESMPDMTPQIKYKDQVSNVSSKDWRVRLFSIIFFLLVAIFLVLGGVRTLSNHSPFGDSINASIPEINDDANSALEHTLVLPNLSETGTGLTYIPPLEEEEAVDQVAISVVTANNGNNDTPAELVVFTTEQLHTAIVRYTQDSWTRIMDNANERVFEGIGKAGQSITVRGEPPFNMRFGVMQGVTVEYKNEIMRVDNHPRRDGRTVIIGEPLPE